MGVQAAHARVDGKADQADGEHPSDQRLARRARAIRSGCLPHLPGGALAVPVETAAGPITVVRQNAGEEIPGEGETVQLIWRPEDVALRRPLERAQ